MSFSQFFLTFLAVCTVTLHAGEVLIEPFHEGEVPAVGLCATSPLYLGQDEGIESLRLQIHLGAKDDLIYPNVLWHYRMGVRHFDIASHGLTANQSKKITMFFDRVKDICTLNLIEALVPSSCSLSSMSEASTTSPALNWVLQLTDRQFLCLYQPLSEILVGASNSTLVVPSCIYMGFDPDAPVSFWPQTDEQLIYRTEINYRKAFSLFSNVCPSTVMLSKGAYVSDFAVMDAAVPFTADMVLDQLPVKEVIIQSIQHACLRGAGYWHFLYLPPQIQNSKEMELHNFMEEFGFNVNIMFGDTYIYLPVPKSAWSVISRTLGSYEANRIICNEAYRGFTKVSGTVIDRYQYLLSDIYKITCVRHPCYRILSGFLDKIINREENDFRQMFGFEERRDITLDEFLRKLRNMPIKEIDEHFRPQYYLIGGNLIKYEKIIRLETFDSEFEEVIAKIGVPGDSRCYEANGHATNASSKCSKYITSECYDLILDFYGIDFEFFGYSKDPTFEFKTIS